MSEVKLSLTEINRIVEYCAEEVRRQYYYEWKAGPDVAMRVSDMVEAWLLALEWQFLGKSLDRTMVKALGSIIEPEKNSRGFRQIPVFVGQSEKLRWTLIDRAVEQLCEGLDERVALEAYVDFENIHPFVDGNGRTGKIILNWVNGSLIDPIFPPNNLWGSEAVNP